MNRAPGAAAALAVLDRAPVSTGKLGMWWFLTGEVVIFGGLLASYAIFRLANPAWNAQAEHLSVLLGAVNTIVLLTSSLCIVMAFRAVDAGEAGGVRLWLSLTVLLGLVFVAIKAVEWSGEIGAGFVPASSGFWSFYFTMTGLHALHVLVGILVNSILLFLAATGRLAPVEQRVEFAGLYWHFVDIVWIFLFPLLYLAR
jgi:cytochrome c oxidase subunit 3